MSNGPHIKFSSDSSQVEKDQAKLIKQQQEMLDKLKGIVKEGKASKDELQKFADATAKINMTPLQKYRSEMSNLRMALKEGAISQETFNRASAKAIDGLRQVGEAGRESFGSKAVSSLANYAAGMMGLAAATGVFRGVMSMARQETQEAKDAYVGLIEQRRNLLQISEPGKFDAVTGKADELAVKYGITRKDSYELLTAAKNEGFEPSVDYIARAMSANLVTQQAASTVAGQVPALFPKTPITPRQALNMNLAAAGSSRLSFEGIAAGLPIAAEGMSQLGSTPAEAMGVMSVLSSRFRSGETAGQRASLLAGKMANDPAGRFAGRGLMAGVDMLSGMSDSQRREFLKDDKETNAAYATLVEERAKVQQRITQADAAKGLSSSDDSLVAIGERQAFDTSTKEGRNWSAFVGKQRAVARREISRERHADEAYLREGTYTDMSTSMEESGRSPAARWLGKGAMLIADDMRRSPRTMETVGRMAEVAGTPPWQWPGLAKDAFDDWRRAGAAQAEAAEEIRAAAQEMRAASPNLSNAARMNRAAGAMPE